jgi:DNA-directed RNA polymerase specialized sigma24 family protein
MSVPSENASQPGWVTRWSVVVAAGTTDAAGREALAWLFRQYWPVLVKHVSRRGCRDADDVVQDFFAKIIQRGSLSRVDSNRGRFRSWLLTCLDHHLANHYAALGAVMRGGDIAHSSLAHVEPVVPAEQDRQFDREWALAVIAEAHDRLAGESASPDLQRRLEVLSPFLERPGDQAAYALAGTTLGMAESAVKVAVHRLRARFREQVEAIIAETLEDPDPSAIAAELDDLLAALRPGR